MYLVDNVKCDVLMLLGTADLRVPPGPNGRAYVVALRNAIARRTDAASKKQKVISIELEGEDHGLRCKEENLHRVAMRHHSAC